MGANDKWFICLSSGENWEIIWEARDRKKTRNFDMKQANKITESGHRRTALSYPPAKDIEAKAASEETSDILKNVVKLLEPMTSFATPLF